MSNGFMLRPHNKQPGMIVCRNRKDDITDESYRHCGCLDCKIRRENEEKYK